MTLAASGNQDETGPLQDSGATVATSTDSASFECVRNRSVRGACIMNILSMSTTETPRPTQECKARLQGTDAKQKHSPSAAFLASVRGFVSCCSVYMKPNAMLVGTRTFAIAVWFLRSRSARPISARQALIGKLMDQTEPGCCCGQNLAAPRAGSKRAV